MVKNANKPIIISGVDSSVIIEDDCACSIDSSVARSVPDISNSVLYKPPLSYSSKISDEFIILFNDKMVSGPVVLNDEALEIYKHFKKDSRLAEHQQYIEEMFSLGLLWDKNLASDMPKNETLTAWIHASNTCNLACTYCYVDKTENDHLDIAVGIEIIRSVFDSAIHHGYQKVKLKYAGGESTLNFEVVKKLNTLAIGLADENNINLDSVLLTNGIALNKSMLEELQIQRMRVSISLDGIGEENDKNRIFFNGKGSFDYIEKALDRLQTASIPTSVTITVSGRNASSLPDTVEYLLDRKLPFMINFYRENDLSANFFNLNYDDQVLIDGLKDAFKIIKRKLPSYSLLNTLSNLAKLEKPHMKPCGVGDSYIAFDHNGNLSKCHMTLDSRIPDVDKQDPLTRVKMYPTVGLQNVNVDDKEECKSCQWKYWCAGGCGLLTYRETGRYDMKSPNCNIYKAIFPEILKLEGYRLINTFKQNYGELTL